LLKLLLLQLAVLIATLTSYGQETPVRGRVYVPAETISPRLSGLTLEVLFKGAVNMYYYSDQETDYYYITDRSGRLYSLNTASKKEKRSKEADIKQTDGIVSVLKLIMADAPSLYDKIETTGTDRHSLVSLMHDYHVLVTGSEDGIAFELLPPALMPRFGVFAGCTADILKADPSGDLSGFLVDPAFYPFIGVTFQSPLPRIGRNLSVSLDLSLAKRYVYGYRSDITDEMEESGTFYELHLHHLLLSTDLMLGYSFGQGSLRPYASGGFSARTIVHDKSRIDTDIYYDGTVISDSNPYSSGKKLNTGIKVSGGLTYELSTSMTLSAAVNYYRYFGDPAFENSSSAGLTIGLIF